MQARNDGEILSDTFTVFAVDGTSQVVTIIITGANDAAVLPVTLTGPSSRPAVLPTARRARRSRPAIVNSTDVDDPNDVWTWSARRPPAPAAIGSYTLTAAGLWTYTLDNTNATVQALNVGQTLTDSFTVTTIDGTQQMVTITINGANDTQQSADDPRRQQPKLQHPRKHDICVRCECDRPGR